MRGCEAFVAHPPGSLTKSGSGFIAVKKARKTQISQIKAPITWKEKCMRVAQS
jgi:hypothetical protein